MATTVEQRDSSVKDEQKKDEDPNIIDMPIISEIGIIYPPPEIRNIIDKTAEFVHKNGIDFEEKIRQREAQNIKFSFLGRNDPYYMYYKHILYEYTLYPNREKAPAKPSFVPQVPVLETKPLATTKSNVKKRHMLIDIDDPNVPTTSLQKFEYFVDTPALAPADLDVVKITAQFVAKNGRVFLQNLLQREAKNYIFDFLKPQHIIYPYFSKLVEQYARILAPTESILNSLKNESAYRESVIDVVRQRYEWISYNNKQARRDIDEKNKDKLNLVDWHDFVVVETITFKDEERDELPPPVSLDQLGARLLSQERFEKLNIKADKTAEEVEETPPTEPIVLKDYDPKKTSDAKPAVKPKTQEKYMVSPITGELVPASKMEAHLKHALMDPKYKEQKQKQMEEKRHEEIAIATGPSIATHLKELAQRRSDIFGPGHEETQIGKKLDEKEDVYVKRSAPVNFEAKQSSQSTFRPPQQHQRPIETPPSTPILPPPLTPSFLPPPLPQNQHSMNPGYPHTGATPANPCGSNPYYHPDGRPKFDEELIPEKQFLVSYGGAPIHIQVRVLENPELSKKNDWQLQGQIEHLTINLEDTISSLKNQLSQTTGVPVSKQKILVGANRFAKDNLSLAYYNIHSNTYIALLLKERGGKR